MSLDLPPRYLLIHRVALGGAGSWCPGPAQGRLRAEARCHLPGFARPGALLEGGRSVGRLRRLSHELAEFVAERRDDPQLLAVAAKARRSDLLAYRLLLGLLAGFATAAAQGRSSASRALLPRLTLPACLAWN